MSALPELPAFGYGFYEEVDYELNIWHGTSYNAVQMREYATAYGDARAAHARRQALEEAAIEFDRRSTLVDGSPSTGWYEPQEPAEIIRSLV